MTTTLSWVSKLANRCGGEACVRDTRMPVWVLVNYKGLGLNDTQLLEWYPSLNQADLEAAWAYAAENAEEVDRVIRENEEGEEGFVE